MKYSNFTIEQITKYPAYQELTQRLLALAKDEDTRRKVERYIIRRWI